MIRRFVEAVQSDKVVLEKHPDLEGWLTWARDEINERDPICRLRSGASLPGVDDSEAQTGGK